MKRSDKLFYTAAAVAVTGLIIYSLRKRNTKKRVAHIADEGYEMAADILHPRTSRRFRKLHYGPVLPHHNL